MCHAAPMSEIEKKLREALPARDAAIEAVYALMAEAVRTRSLGVSEVAAITGYSRVHVGRILRSRGVPDARRRHDATPSAEGAESP
jgi:DNA-binding phage protein